MNWQFVIKVLVRLVVSVIIGVIIGTERERRGRAAGMRTHILVSLGACLTSLMSIYVSEILNKNGDIMRISAQVISGIGFLGAGMILLKDNNVITGLTTAAGVWTTSIIGICVGYGFYSGAVIAAFLFLTTIVLFSKLEKRKKSTENIYIEISDMSRANEIIEKIDKMIDTEISHRVTAPKSAFQGNLGLNVIIQKRNNFDIRKLLKIDGVIFVEEE